MIRLIKSNFGLKVAALLLALGIVFVKAQENIFTRTLRNIEISLENIPPNYRLPENWIVPTVQLRVYGPNNVINSIRPERSYIQIDFAAIPLDTISEPYPVLLEEDMFFSNSDEETAKQFTVSGNSIRPQQITIRKRSWKINQSPPDRSQENTKANEIEIPLYRIEKDVQVIMLTVGDPPPDVLYEGYSVTPEFITLTGRLESLERIKSLPTEALDLSGLSVNTLTVSLPLQTLQPFPNVAATGTERHEVTIHLKVKKK